LLSASSALSVTYRRGLSCFAAPELRSTEVDNPMTIAASNLRLSADLSASSKVRDRVPDIVSDRVELISITPEMLRADFAKSPEFSKLIGAEVPAAWPSDGWDEDAYSYLLERMEKYPEYRGWSRYIAVKSSNGVGRILAGGCGLLGPVEQTDDPEIGYGLLNAFQHHGYATEAVAALVGWIFGHAHVKSVNAQTFPDHHASLGVLARCGFAFAGDGPGPEAGTVLYRRWRE
jgi:ribosomal-protein-alanine N-acetyltransferase